LPTTAGMQEVEQCRSNCRRRGFLGRWHSARCPDPPVGAEFSVYLAVSVSNPPGGDGQGTGDRSTGRWPPTR